MACTCARAPEAILEKVKARARAYILLRRRGHATSAIIEIFQCYYF